jgi:hypothetical protein
MANEFLADIFGGNVLCTASVSDTLLIQYYNKPFAYSTGSHSGLQMRSFVHEM